MANMEKFNNLMVGVLSNVAKMEIVLNHDKELQDIMTEYFNDVSGDIKKYLDEGDCYMAILSILEALHKKASKYYR